jgi:N-methylhydantoinase A
VDVGGTYTDCVAVDHAGVTTACKALTTPADRTLGVVDSLRAAAGQLGLGDLRSLLTATTALVHGSTVATNVMVERRGARTALLTTRGHEDAIFIGRGRQRVAGLSESQITHVTQHRKPAPLVSREHVIGLAERVDSSGTVLRPLDPAEVQAALARLASDGIEALAICLLWSIRNPAHERLIAELAARQDMDCYISLSSDVAPVLGEYERLTSTVINAYIGPAVTAYTTRLADRLRDAGLAIPVLFAQANGGLATADHVQDRPIVMLDSGPAAGVRGVAAFSAGIAQRNVLCADVGGTTFDVGVVTAGVPEQDEFPVLDQFEFRMPKIGIKSIGAGGGSIAWSDSQGALRVGPRSAGASPGPACYGRGGTEPTVTDAYLVLGYLDPGAPLASGITLDLAAAQTAVGAVAAKLGRVTDECAAAIVAISENQMGDLLHRVTLERGLDPRDFALAVYGGAGPLYAAPISAAVGIPAVHVMPEAGSFSALGMLSTDLVWTATASLAESLPLSPAALGRLRDLTRELAATVAQFFARQHIAVRDVELRTSVGMRFALQAYHLAVEVPDIEAVTSAELAARFLAQYQGLYGPNSVFSGASTETVRVTVTGICRVGGRPVFGTAAAAALAGAAADGGAPVSRASGEAAQPVPAGQREVFFGGHGRLSTAIYNVETLSSGQDIAGPAIVHRSGDTIAVPPGWQLSAGRHGDLVLRREDS